MRTTITIPEDLLRKTQKIAGSKGYSQAIVSSLKDYISLKERLNYLQSLFSKKSPHSFRKIKTYRKKRRWSL